MINLNRILIITVVVLFLAFAAQFLYFTNIAGKPQLAPSNLTGLYPSPNPNQALRELSLAQMRLFKLGLVTQSVHSYTLEGTLINFRRADVSGETQIELELQATNSNTNLLIYPEAKLQIVSVLTPNKPMQYANLTKNRVVKLEATYDLLTGELLSAKLTLL